MLLPSTNSTWLHASTKSTPRQGRKQAAIYAVQLRTPYESASFDDWEVRAEIEEQIKRKQARKMHEARRRGASVERRQSTQRFYAAEQAAFRERRAREEAHTHYLESVAERAQQSARAANQPPRRPRSPNPLQLQSEADAAYRLLAAKTSRFSEFVTALEQRKAMDTMSDRRGRPLASAAQPSVQQAPMTPPTRRRSSSSELLFDPKTSIDTDDDFVWADEL